MLYVAIECHERCQGESNRQRQAGRNQGNDGQPKPLQRRPVALPKQQAQQENLTDYQVDDTRGHCGTRQNRAWKIDLVEKIVIGGEGGAGGVYGVRKEHPWNQTAQCEQRIRNRAGFRAENAREDEGKNHHRQDGLQHRPKNTEEGLPVAQRDITKRKKKEQGAILPILGDFLRTAKCRIGRLWSSCAAEAARLDSPIIGVPSSWRSVCQARKTRRGRDPSAVARL